MRKERQGLTAVEYLVNLASLVIFVAILLPALIRGREVARATQCQNNLRDFSIGFEQFVKADELGRFCSGAFDWKRDGCPDSYGWVANVVNIRAAAPAKKLCPSNEGRVSETFNDLLGYEGSSGEFASNQPKDGLEDLKDGHARFEAGLCSLMSDDLSSASGWLSSGARSAYVKTFHDRGYASNYAASWFFSRSSMKVAVYGSKVVPMTTQKGATGGYLGIRCSDVNGSLMSTSTIPFLGDATSRDSVLQDDIGNRTTGLLYAKGQRVVASFGDGPHAWYFNGVKGELEPLSRGGNRDLLGDHGALTGDLQPLRGEAGDNNVHGGADGLLWLQETRNWAPVHGWGSRRIVNLLFLDTSIRQLYDQNGDGLINPGFAVDTALGSVEKQEAQGGYADNVAEFGPAEVYSLPVLRADDLTKAIHCD